MSFEVVCPACRLRFTIPVELYERKVKGRVTTIRCIDCGAEIAVDGTDPRMPPPARDKPRPPARTKPKLPTRGNPPPLPARPATPQPEPERQSQDPLPKPSRDRAARKSQPPAKPWQRKPGKPPSPGRRDQTPAAPVAAEPALPVEKRRDPDSEPPTPRMQRAIDQRPKPPPLPDAATLGLAPEPGADVSSLQSATNAAQFEPAPQTMSPAQLDARALRAPEATPFVPPAVVSPPIAPHVPAFPAAAAPTTPALAAASTSAHSAPALPFGPNAPGIAAPPSATSAVAAAGSATPASINAAQVDVSPQGPRSAESVPAPARRPWWRRPVVGIIGAAAAFAFGALALSRGPSPESSEASGAASASAASAAAQVAASEAAHAPPAVEFAEAPSAEPGGAEAETSPPPSPVTAAQNKPAARAGSGSPSIAAARPSPNTGAARPATTAAKRAAPSAVPPRPAPAPEGTEFDSAAAASSLSEMAAQASGCRKPGDPTGSIAIVIVTFAPSGRVTSAQVNGKPFAGTETGGCIAATMRRAHVPPFSGKHMTVSKTVQIR